MTYRRSTSLTPMALRAIHYYMVGHSKAESMRRAGYAEASTLGNNEKFWKSKAVRAEIKERMRKLQVKTDITVESLVRLLSELLVVHPGDLLGSDGKMVAAESIPSHVARALNWKVANGKVYFESIDKIKIIELIAKLTGLSKEVIEVRGEADLAAKIAAARSQLSLEDKSGE